MSAEIRRGTARFTSRLERGQTRHSFSFGEHYDPGRTGFGPMVCHDDHHLAGGAGFSDHPHRDTEIVTWVLGGALEHGDDHGHTGRIEPGTVQVLSAGSGVTHREVALPGVGPTRFVQVWLTPDEPGRPPAYAAVPVDLPPGELVVVASGRAGVAAPARLGTSSATFLVARLETGQSVRLPDDARQHLFVARGALTRSSLAEPLDTGDALLLTDEPGKEVTAAVPTELLLWTFTGPAPADR